MIKKLMKTSSLMLIFLFCFGATAFANEESAINDDRFKIEDDLIVDTETNTSYGSAQRYNEDGVLVEVSLEDLKVLLEAEESSINPKKESILINNDDISTPQQIIVYNYIQNRSYTYIGTRMAISAWQVGGTITSTSGWSVTESFSVNVGQGAGAVRAGASFGWNTTATRTVSHSLPVDAGKRGRMVFLPEYNATQGTLYNNVGAPSQSVTGYSPKRVNGQPDGTYFIEYSN